jgi:hypothetical protein
MKLTEKQLTRVIYSLWDIQQALSALTFLAEDCDFDKEYDKVSSRRFRCYESTLIISMCRPLLKTRNYVTLGLKALGIKLTVKEGDLIDKVKDLRGKVIGHSAQEKMHFRTTTKKIKGVNFPIFTFNERLYLEKNEFLELDILLRKMIRCMSDFIWEVSQSSPELLEKYQDPHSQCEVEIKD